MQGSYRTAWIVETRSLLVGRLRHCVRAVEQEHAYLLTTSPLSTTATRWNGSRCHGIASPGASRRRRTIVVPW